MVLFHSGFGWASGGFLGVSLFFTLSGFLITTLLLAEHRATGAVALPRFYVRRARRLLPASLVCLVLVMAAGSWWTDSQRRRLPGDVLASLGEVANWRAALAETSYRQMFEQAASPLAHFWSLSIEEQCYLLLPVVVLVCVRRSRRALVIVLAVMAALSTVAMAFTDDFDLAYNATHTRAAELLVGALAAAVLAGRRPEGRALHCAGAATLALFALLVGTTTLDSAWVVNGGLTLFAAGSALLVVAASTGPLGRVLGWSPLAYVGRVSYGVYLYHWPIFLVLSPDRVGLDGVALLLVRLVAVGVVVTASYHLVEQPVRAGRVLADPRRAMITLASSTAVLAVIAAVGLPRPAPSSTEKLLARADQPVVTFAAAAAASDQEPVQGMVSQSAPTPAAPDVLVLGSASLDLGVAQDAGIVVESAVDGRCPMPRGDEVRLEDGRVVSIAGCADMALDWAAAVASVQPRAVVVSLGPLDAGLVRRRTEVGFPAPGDIAESAQRLVWAESEITRVLGALAETGRPVVVVDQSGSELFGALLARVARASPDLRVADAGSASQAIVGAVGAFGGLPLETERPLRVLVLGDSTSFLVADALSGAASGSLDVVWAGQEGCPLASIAATRSSATSDWVEASCVPWAEKVAPLLEPFDPDVVLFVAGGSQLLEHRYPGDPEGHLPGSAGYIERHEIDLAALLGALRGRGVPVFVADAPPLETGGFVTEAMTEPARLAAWNDLIGRWDQQYDELWVWPYADAIEGYEAVHGSIRPDGSHPEIEPLTEIARAELVGRLKMLVARATSGAA